MGYKCHRYGDTRVCGATTVVIGQSTVTIDGKLWAVKGDTNTHSSGALINSTGTSVTINGIPIIVHGPDHASADDLCIPVGEPHCDPYTSDGATNTVCY